MEQMGKRQKFAEELLLTAVVKYAEVCKTKIKTTELAEWSRKNIMGLEEVRNYHFTRPITEINAKTGAKFTRKKQCTEKIEDINRTRSITNAAKDNVLLNASNMDRFFSLSVAEQRRQVAEARDLFHMTVKKNARLTVDNDALKKMNKELEENQKSIEIAIKEAQKTITVLMEKANHITVQLEEEKSKEILEEIGLKDGIFDLSRYWDSLKLSEERVLKISKDLRQYMLEDSREMQSAAEKEILDSDTSLDVGQQIMDRLDF